jgi:two-component system response regulator HydG
VGQSCRILDCTGCKIIGKGAGKQWCGLYRRGGVRAKKCTITNKEHRTVTIVKNASILRNERAMIIGAVETLKDMSEVVRQQQEILSLAQNISLGRWVPRNYGAGTIHAILV